MIDTDQKPNAETEANKLHFDAFKHLTTLSTGAILILVALLEKLFINPRWKILIAVSLISFVTSITTSVLMMFVLAEDVGGVPMTHKRANFHDLIVFPAMATFLIGIISFVVFAIKNFYH